ncbi:MAG: HAMP domain-containing sensor histidine kinase [bacterium]
MPSAVMQPASEREDAELFRREAMGAFAHEVRTPLTSIKMVMELARRQSNEGELLLDAELADMLRSSVEDLQSLADDLQEASRLERGKVSLSPGPCEIGAAVEAARDLLRSIEIAGTFDDGLEGPWDAARLVRAIAGFTESANRIGDGSGIVRLEAESDADSVALVFSSGQPGRAARAIAADAGFAFFRSRQLVLAMGGSVHCERAERYATFRVVLPLRLSGDSK